MRYYVGVDWADQTHAVWVVDERGTKITARTVPHTAEGFSEWGRELDEWRAQGIERWAAIERPDGRVVDVLLDHGVVVYPVNPKALDRALGAKWLKIIFVMWHRQIPYDEQYHLATMTRASSCGSVSHTHRLTCTRESLGGERRGEEHRPRASEERATVYQ
jgi:transposase